MAKCQSGAAFVVSSVSAVSLVLCGDAYALRMEEASTAANRGQGGAASGTEHASTHRGFVAGVVGDGGQVRSGRREVVIMDHGTGVAASVAAMVLLDEAEVELLAPADDPSTEVLDPLRIELWPTESADKVTLVDETRDPESRRLVLEHDWVADRLAKVRFGAGRGPRSKDRRPGRAARPPLLRAAPWRQPVQRHRCRDP